MEATRNRDNLHHLDEVSLPDRRKATRKALVRAARDLVLERGHEKISIQDITGRAQVGTGTFYNYFQTKQDVFEAVILDYREEFTATLTELRKNIKDPAMMIAVALKYYFRLAQDNAEWNSFVTFSGLPGTHVLHQDEQQCLADIKRGVSAGRFKVEDPHFAQSLITGMVRHTMLAVADGTLGPSATDNTARYVLRMLGLPDLVAKAVTQDPLPPVAAPRKEPVNIRVIP